jgi:amino acid adenylation domain-containing protein
MASAVAEGVAHVANIITNEPQTTIGAVDLFGAASWSQLQKWNSTVPSMIEVCMHDLIDEQAKLRPDSIALECWDGAVSYAQLVDYTARLGSFLITQKVGPEVFVPVCFDKSLWAVVSMLGVMKAGGAFVCIDPAQPVDRLQTIISEVDAQIALGAPAYRDTLAGLTPNAIAIDADFILSLPPPSDLPRVSPKEAAFAIFTSGSTGKPKGIVHEHRAMCSSAKRHAASLNINSATRTFQFAAYTFIVNTFELFTPLVEGGCVCIPSKEDRLGRTTGAMRDLKANWVCLTPSFLRSIKPEELPQLQTLLLAGEPVQQDNLDTWRHRVKMLNMYGASEASICVAGDLSGPVGRSTIGTGAGCTTWIVDTNDHNRLAPIGAIGELVIEGPILAREYINQSEKTAEVFISNTPWMEEMRGALPSRAYKTGDLVRYGSDGLINLVGRKDMQIKLRGQRIELEEVEFHLRQAVPRGTEVAVGLVKPMDQPDRPMLVAFVSLKKAFGDNFHTVDQNAAEELESRMVDWKIRLADSVPGYMVPSTVVKLNHMPLTASGKTNRKAISEFACTLTVTALTGAKKKEHKEPATGTGKVLRSMWSEVLNMEEESISSDDSFLQLGGNSIDAMRLVNLARNAKVGLSVADIFAHPVLDEMAACSSELDVQIFEDVPFSLVGNDIDNLIQEAASQCQVGPLAIEDLYPCTAMQEGLMALSDSRDGAYVAQHTLSLGPAIDIHRFKQACQKVVDAHPVLRTRIVYPGQASALQAVVHGDIEWHTADTMDAYVKADKQKPMKAGEPLTRYGLVPNGKSWMFVWTVHHAVYDAWTLDLTFDRLDKAYKDQPIERDTSFKEFISYVTEVDPNASQQFWQEYLAGATRNEFPSVVSTSKQPVADASAEYDMKLTRTDELAGITLASMIRAAWGILIGSHSESDDVVFGTIVSGRNTPIANADQLFGPGIAAVPVRVKFPDNDTLTIRDFIGEVQAQSMKMISFEQAGLQHIRRVSSDAAAACDFQTLLVIQPSKEKHVSTSEIDLRGMSGPDANFGTYALTLECSLKPDGVSCAAHYDSSLVSPESVERILGQLENLLYQMCSSPAEKKLNELVFISAQDQESIRQWNQNIPKPIHKTIHEMIGETISKRPDYEAVCSWDGSFTYAELDQHSSRLARRLAQLNIQPESFVPCCFEKSKWAIPAMLGVLRAGGAFLNLDPSQPGNRIQLMIKKLNAQTIVCSPQQYDLCRSMGEGYNIVVLDVESPEESLPKPPPVDVKPENAAYVIFTSGSTGEPKGTIIQHGHYAIGSVTHAPAMLIDGNTRALQFASFTFDASLVETITILIAGGCICVASEEQRKRDVAEAVRATRANWAALTPSFVNLLSPDDVPSIKVLILAGEAMSQSHIDTWGHRVRLVNGYGPSECCVASTSNVDVVPGTNPRNIGYTCSGLAWVVMPTNHHRLMPVGSVGELVLEGWNVGRGYLEEPIKTQAAFVKNPLWMDLGDEMRSPVVYKTGDLVRYNADGSLEFQRRKDTQVKLRGQRVELGEIEYRIKQSLANKPDAVVDIVCPKDAPDQPRLVAFIPVPASEARRKPTSIFMFNQPESIIPQPNERHLASVSGLEDRLSDFLPMHMIPNAYIPVYHIPKMPSGKADRKTLIRIGSGLTHRQMAEYSGATEDARPPTTEMQFTLQELWGEVLKMPAAQISLNDNFLRLGGDSITAMRLASAARIKGIPLSTATIFQHPTLEAISAVSETLSQQHRPQNFEPFSTLKSIPKDQLLDDIILPQLGIPAFQIQDALECTDFQSLAINGGLNQTRGWSNYLIFDFDGPIDLRRLQAACEKLVAHHDVLRTVFVSTGSQLIQVVLRSVVPEYSMHIRDEEDPTESLIREDLARPPHLGEPIVRFMIVKDDATHHRLIMRISHAQYDGGSMPHLMNDLRTAYRCEDLPKRAQFADFVRMQMHTSDGAKSFYTDMLAGSTMTSVVSHSKTSVTNVLNTMHADMMPLVAFKNHGITAATVVKAAWALVLAEMAATADVVYGHMVSGRNLPLDGVESIMGPCLNIVPVRANMTNMHNVLDLLRTIQQQQTDTIPHESMGFQQIINQCTEWTPATRFSSVFQYQDFGTDEAAPGQPVSFESVLKCAPGFVCPAPDACDMSILATPVGEQIRVEMIFSSHAMSTEFAQRMLKNLAAKLDLISRDVEAPLATLEICLQQAQIPLPEPGSETSGLSGIVNAVVNGLSSQANGTNDINGVDGNSGTAPIDKKLDLLASVRIN